MPTLINQIMPGLHLPSATLLVSTLDRSKEKLIKILQYTCLLISFYHENRDNKAQRYDYFFKYKDVFNIRRVFRVGEFLVDLNKSMLCFSRIKREFSAERLFELLSSISKTIFYLVDHTAVVMNFMHLDHYYLARRVSFSIFLLHIFVMLIYCVIKLTRFYKEERKIKSPIEAGKLEPKEFLNRLKELDLERYKAQLDLGACLGDLIPTLERTNLNQVLIKTRMNKGTVGWSGIVAAVCELLRVQMD